MTVNIPELDNKTYQALIDELVGAIPVYSKTWTNFNDSDPGITLLQLFAWVGETLMYRLNQIPQPTFTNFMALVAGATAEEIQTELSRLQQSGNDLDYEALLDFLQAVENGRPISVEEIQRAVLDFRDAPYLAVTTDDFETLAMASNRTIPKGKPNVTRAIVTNNKETVFIWIVGSFSNSGLTTFYFKPQFPNTPPYLPGAPTRLTLMGKIVKDEAQAYTQLLPYVTSYLQPRYLLGSVVQVQPAQFTPVDLEIDIVCAPGIDLEPIVQIIAHEIIAWLSPVSGGPEGLGWPYDRQPEITDIKNMVMEEPGVLFIERIELSFAPTIWLGELSTVGVNTLVQPSQPGLAVPRFKGLPRLRLLDLKAYESTHGTRL